MLFSPEQDLTSIMNEAFGGEEVEKLAKEIKKNKSKSISLNYFIAPLLVNIINSDVINEIANDKEFEERMKEFLPEEHQNREGFEETMHSPQFLQALTMLNKVAESDQVKLLLSSFGLDTNNISQATDGLDALLKAIIKKYSKK
jgi:hypothetical protein